MAVTPVPNAALLLPCVDPAVAASDTPTDNDYGLTMLNLARAYVDCRQRQADLARWVREQ